MFLVDPLGLSQELPHLKKDGPWVVHFISADLNKECDYDAPVDNDPEANPVDSSLPAILS